MLLVHTQEAKTKNLPWGVESLSNIEINTSCLMLQSNTQTPSNIHKYTQDLIAISQQNTG